MKRFFETVLCALSLLWLCACSSEENAAEAAPAEDGGVIGVNMKAEPEISYCMPRYMTDPETRAIGEVFSGSEITYGRLTLRTDPNRRAGMYFFVMFGYEPDDIGLACQLELSVDTTDSAKAKTYTFTVPETSSVLREIRLGITGKDWPNSKAAVNAWKLVVKSPSGKILTQTQSWLWSAKNPNTKSEKAAESVAKPQSQN